MNFSTPWVPVRLVVLHSRAADISDLGAQGLNCRFRQSLSATKMRETFPSLEHQEFDSVRVCDSRQNPLPNENCHPSKLLQAPGRKVMVVAVDTL